MPRDRELLIKKEMLECKHFTGIQHDTCKAGVNYREIVGGSDLGWATRLPCGLTRTSDKHGDPVTCEKIEHLTYEEAVAEVDAMEERYRRHGLAHRTAHADAKTKGYGRNHGGVSQCVCPLCNGTLRYSVASYNGHMHAQCETQGCVSWME